jgi:hypothetical protein
MARRKSKGKVAKSASFTQSYPIMGIPDNRVAPGAPPPPPSQIPLRVVKRKTDKPKMRHGAY